MSNETKQFEWTDELVMEIIGLTHRAGYHKEPAKVYDRVIQFKQSKLQSQDKPQPSPIDRIEVTTCGHANWNEPNGGAFIFKTNKPIRYNDFPSEKIKQAIEAVLNGDTVVEDDIVGLLRDCVSSTWGNPSLDRTQELFDKFLLDRKLVNPTLKDVNKTVTKLVNEILLDKKYPTIEDYLNSLSTPTTQPTEEDKPVVIENNDRCGICGGEMVYIRGRYPNTDKRKVCPTCITERLEQISDLCSPEYGKAYQNKN